MILLGGVIVALTDAGLLKAFHNDPRPCFIFTLCFTVGTMISLLGEPKHYRIVASTSPLRKDALGKNREGTLALVKI